MCRVLVLVLNLVRQCVNVSRTTTVTEGFNDLRIDTLQYHANIFFFFSPSQHSHSRVAKNWSSRQNGGQNNYHKYKYVACVSEDLKVLRCLRHYLHAQIQGRHKICRLDWRKNKLSDGRRPIGRVREGPCHWNRHWYCLKGSTEVPSVRFYVRLSVKMGLMC